MIDCYNACLFQMAKDIDVNPHAIEAWKVTKSTVKGIINNSLLSIVFDLFLQVQDMYSLI